MKLVRVYLLHMDIVQTECCQTIENSVPVCLLVCAIVSMSELYTELSDSWVYST